MFKEKQKLFNLVIYLVFLVLLIVTVSLKENYHIDEYYSFNLANHDGISSLEIEDNVKYNNYEDVFLEYTSVQNNNRFNIKNVINNQKNDVHPPLYYLLLNFICSLFPHSFSKWYPAFINIISALIILIFVQKIVKCFTNEKSIYYLISIIFIFTTGILDDTAFFRMYMLAMMWTTILAYLFISRINLKTNNNYLLIVLVTYFGSLTHYYFIFYAILISISYGIYLLAKKEYKSTLYFCLTMAIVGLCSYLTFPSMIDQVFHGYRGTEAISNFFNLSDYITRFIIFFKQTSNELFGNLLLVLLILIAVLLVYYFIIKKNKIDNFLLGRYLILLIPTIIYYVVVVKIAAYLNERYFSLIYPLVILCVFLIIFSIVKEVSLRKYKVIIVLISLTIIISGFAHAKWEYLYRDTLDIIASSKNNKGVDCLCIHGDSGKDILYNAMEFVNYGSFYMTNENSIVLNDVYKLSDKLVLKLQRVDNVGHCLDKIKESYPQFKNYELIGNARNGVTYLLY